MKILLLYFTIGIGTALVIWACFGNRSFMVIESGTMWWHIPAFIICLGGTIMNLIPIIKLFF